MGITAKPAKPAKPAVKEVVKDVKHPLDVKPKDPVGEGMVKVSDGIIANAASDGRFLYPLLFYIGGVYRRFTFTIQGVIPPNTLKADNKKLIDKPIVAFTGTDKMWVLNKTNTKRIIAATGEQPRRWPGCEVTLEPRVMPFCQVPEPTNDLLVLRVYLPPGTPCSFVSKQALGNPLIQEIEGEKK